MPGSTVDLDKFRALLVQERTRLEREMERFHAEVGPGGDDSRRREWGTTDGTVSLSELEREMGYHDQLEGMLKEVDLALQRIDEQTYGRCELCGRSIPEARLEALPFAKLCLECQEKTEG